MAVRDYNLATGTIAGRMSPNRALLLPDDRRNDNGTSPIRTVATFALVNVPTSTE